MGPAGYIGMVLEDIQNMAEYMPRIYGTTHFYLAI